MEFQDLVRSIDQELVRRLEGLGRSLPDTPGLEPVTQRCHQLQDRQRELRSASEAAIVGLIGSAGAGKSTLARQLGGGERDDFLTGIPSGAAGLKDTAVPIFYGRPDRLGDVYERFSFKGARLAVAAGNTPVVAFLKPELDIRRTLDSYSGRSMPQNELEALLPREHKGLALESGAQEHINLEEALNIVRRVVMDTYQAYRDGTVALTDSDLYKRFTSYQNADRQQCLWPLVERIEIRIPDMLPNLVLVDLPHNPDPTMVDMMDLIIFVITADKARNLGQVDYDSTLAKAIRGDLPYMAVITHTSNFDLLYEVTQPDIVAHANATVARIPLDLRAQWEKEPITEERLQRLRQQDELKEIVGLRTCNTYVYGLKRSLEERYPTTQTNNQQQIPPDRIFAVDTLDAVRIKRCEVWPNHEKPATFRTMAATGIPSVKAALARMAVNVMQQRTLRFLRRIETDLRSLLGTVENLLANAVAISDEAVRTFRLQAGDGANRLLGDLNQRWYQKLNDTMRDARTNAADSVMAFALDLHNKNKTTVWWGFRTRGGSWRCVDPVLGEGFNANITKSVLKAFPLYTRVMAGVFFDNDKDNFNTLLIQLVQSSIHSVLAPSGMPAAEIQQRLSAVTANTEALLVEVDEEDFKPAVTAARRIFDEPPNSTKEVVGPWLRGVYERNRQNKVEDRINALVNELNRFDDEQPVCHHVVREIMLSALNHVMTALQNMQQGAMLKIGRLLDRLMDELNALRAERPTDNVHQSLLVLRTEIDQRLNNLAELRQAAVELAMPVAGAAADVVVHPMEQ